LSATTLKMAYVLVTPARNEAAHLEKTILSVISQTVLPMRWVIVSDGSTDGTDEIANSYSRQHEWITVLRLPEHRERHFASKVQAFNAGYAILRPIRFDVIGNLDADISFGKDYFSFLLQKFLEEPRLGVAGTPFIEEGFAGYDYRFTNVEHVSGACQMFRRKCFEDIGGYSPIKGGGIDWVAVTTARMKGWKTRSFSEMKCRHHRRIGTADSNIYAARFKDGSKDRYFGNHPLWQTFRCVYQMKNRPYVVGGMMLMLGYCWEMLRKTERPLGHELVAFHRREQMFRLKNILKGSFLGR
jgi:biofilm PGA synthesis N-glycosyltransferase PgaC